MGGEINEKEGVGKIMEAVVGSADKMAIWSNQIYQEEGNQKEPFIFTVDQYLESVEIFIQSLSPEIESGNNVSKQAPTGHGFLQSKLSFELSLIIFLKLSHSQAL